jgi:hypothetical protein
MYNPYYPHPPLSQPIYSHYSHSEGAPMASPYYRTMYSFPPHM